MKPKRLTIFYPGTTKGSFCGFFYRRNFVCSVNVQTAMMPQKVHFIVQKNVRSKIDCAKSTKK